MFIYKSFVFLILSYFCFQKVWGQDCGCNDAKAQNFVSKKLINDGSCTYKKTVLKSSKSVVLSSEIKETSGLIHFENYLVSINDDTDTHLYFLNKNTGNIDMKLELTNVKNKDWEALSQDATHIYIGDFGNNGSGKRSPFTILRVEKSSIFTKLKIDTITFDYENRIIPTEAEPNNTNYDCEAFIVTNDSIYLFTKQWKNNKTSVYSIAKKKGHQLAKKKSEYAVNGLITDANYNTKLGIVVLSGYTQTLQPFVYLLYDFKGYDFFSGNVRRVAIDLPFYQIEGVVLLNDYTMYITNERFCKKFLPCSEAQLHQFSIKKLIE